MRTNRPLPWQTAGRLWPTSGRPGDVAAAQLRTTRRTKDTTRHDTPATSDADGEPEQAERTAPSEADWKQQMLPRRSRAERRIRTRAASSRCDAQTDATTQLELVRTRGSHGFTAAPRHDPQRVSCQAGRRCWRSSNGRSYHQETFHELVGSVRPVAPRIGFTSDRCCQRTTGGRRTWLVGAQSGVDWIRCDGQS